MLQAWQHRQGMLTCLANASTRGFMSFGPSIITPACALTLSEKLYAEGLLCLK